MYNDDDVRERAHRDLFLALSRSEDIIEWEFRDGEDMCLDCDTRIGDMSPDKRDQHFIRRGRVLVGCEGYVSDVFVITYRFYLALSDRNFEYRAGDRIATRSRLLGTVTRDYRHGVDGGISVEWDADDDGGPYEDDVWHGDVGHVLTEYP